MGLLRFLQRLSPRVEFVVVVVIAFGPFLVGYLWELILPLLAFAGTSQFRLALAYELLAATTLIAFLALRGWTPKLIGLKPTFKETLGGLALLSAGLLSYVAIMAVLAVVWPKAFDTVAAVDISFQKTSLAGIASVSLVNGIYEELFVCGYVVTALDRRDSPWMAINVSAGLRFAYHLYQGPLAVVGIIPMAVMFAFVYARTRRLWPLMVAHIVWDFWALLPFVR